MSIKKRTFNGCKKYVQLYNVYDGDTIEIITKLDRFEQNKRYMLRLKGIDALELKPKKTINDREIMIEYAKKIKYILSRILTPILYVEFEQEDKYGRLLGTVYLTKSILCCFRKKELNINKWLLENRLVVAYNGGTKIEYNIDWIRRNMVNINYIYGKYKI